MKQEYAFLSRDKNTLIICAKYLFLFGNFIVAYLILICKINIKEERKQKNKKTAGMETNPTVFAVSNFYKVVTLPRGHLP